MSQTALPTKDDPMTTSNVSREQGDVVLRTGKDSISLEVAEDRVASWDWFLHLLNEHGYKGQPIWNEATSIARSMRAERRNARGRITLTLDLAFTQAADWLNRLAESGPDLTVNAHRKTAHEAQELAEEPSLEEFADVVICLVGTALHHGWSEAEVARAVMSKVSINSARTWAQEPDGTWQHVPALSEGESDDLREGRDESGRGVGGAVPPVGPSAPHIGR